MAESESPLKMEMAFIKCPICLEDMNNPKSIPCLHTFCESCLGSYIEKQQEVLEGQSKLSGFPCPICSRTTLPVDVSKDVKLWAKEYPSNTLVVALEAIKKIKIKEKLCNPCHTKNGTSTAADLWCQECKLFFCYDCKALHDMFSSGHTLISKESIAENPFEGISHKFQCEKHGEASSFVCVTHHSIACSTCITLEHRHCGKIMTTKECCQNIKQNKEIDSLIQKFDLAIEDMDGLIEVTKSRFTTLEEEKNISEVEMGKQYEKMKNHLAKLNENDLANLSAVYKDEKAKNEMKLKRCEQLKTAMDYSRRALQTTLQYGNEAAVVSINEKGKEEFAIYCKNVEQEFKNNTTKTLSASHSRCMEPFETAKTISDVVTTPTGYHQRLPRVVDIFSYRPQVQALMAIDGKLPDDALECNFTGLLFIKWNRIVAVDNSNQKLKLFSNKGDILSHLIFPHRLWEVCEMDNGDLAVSGCQDKRISCVNIKDDRLVIMRTVNINVESYGIVFKDQSFLVSSVNTQKGIHCYSSEGVHLHTISAFENVMHLIGLPKSGNLVASQDNTKPHDNLLQLFTNTKDGSAEIILNSECHEIPSDYLDEDKMKCSDRGENAFLSHTLECLVTGSCDHLHTQEVEMNPGFDEYYYKQLQVQERLKQEREFGSYDYYQFQIPEETTLSSESKEYGYNKFQIPEETTLSSESEEYGYNKFQIPEETTLNCESEIPKKCELNPESYQGARGIAADDQDNIYVCLKTSNHVAMISKDRQTRTLLSESDNITNPTAISIKNNEFILAEANSNTLKMFRLI